MEEPKTTKANGWSKTRSVIKCLTPPILIDLTRRWRSSTTVTTTDEVCDPVEWEYVAAGWQAERVDPRIKGWNVDSVLRAYLKNWRAFIKQLEGALPLGVSLEADIPSQADLAAHNTIMSYAYALAYSTRHQNSISMLDWGGGLGNYYLISRALIPDLEIYYHCKDVPVLASHGNQLLPEAHFHTDDGCLKRSYDFVLASGSLHYSEDWRATLTALAHATAGHIFITRFPIVQRAPSYVFVQRPYQYGYDTEYLGWCLNRMEFLQAARDAGLDLIREFIIGEQPPIKGALGTCEYRGFLFRPAQT